MQRSNNAMRVIALTLAAGMLLAGCSTDYYDHRDTISLSGGNAIAANKVTQMVDPWPRESANKNIAFNGEKMQTAVERYRKNKVTNPRGIGTSGTYQSGGSDPGGGGGGNAAPVGPTVTQSAAPTK